MTATRSATLAALLLWTAAPSMAADRDFEAVVRGLESQSHVRRTRIPLFGLAKLVVRVAHPRGVSQLDLAVFDGLAAPPSNGAFDAVVRDAAGGRWQPLVRVRSRHGCESTYIYSRAGGRNLHLLIAAFHGADAAVIRVKVSERALLDLLAEPASAGRRALGDR